MQVKSTAECSKGSTLQYFRPLLSYHLSLISLFCLFLSGRLRQVLLYSIGTIKCYGPANLYFCSEYNKWVSSRSSFVMPKAVFFRAPWPLPAFKLYITCCSDCTTRMLQMSKPLKCSKCLMKPSDQDPHCFSL